MATLGRKNLTITDSAGSIVNGANVEVRKEIPGQPLAVPYSDRAGIIALGNPFVAADGANAGFYGKFADNARAWHKRAQEAVLYLNHALVNPPIDR